MSAVDGEISSHKRMPSAPGLVGLKALTDMISQHLQRMKEQDSLVEAAIDNVVDKENQVLLRRAKQRALDDERELLNSLQVLELGDFLRATVLVQKMYDELFAPHKSEQESARSVYASDMEEYEKKPKPLTEGSNIVSLMFGAQHLYLPAFEKFISQVLSEYKKQKIKVLKHSKVSCKNIERAFYKTYYVYVGDHKQMTDLMRCSFVFDNFVDLYRAFAIMKKIANENTAMKGGILRAKDRFNPPEIPFGYRDLLVNINCPGTNLVCEVQFHHEIFYKFKKDSHYVYKRARLFEVGDRNMAYDYVTEHIKPKIGKNEHYVPRTNFGKNEEGSDNEDDNHEGKTTKGEDETPKVTCEELLKKWLPDKTKKSPDGVIQIDVDGTPKSYLQILEEDGFDSVDSWEDLNEEDLKGMGFKTGNLRSFLKLKNEHFDSIKKKKEEKIQAIEKAEKDRNERLEKDLQSKQEEKKREEQMKQREIDQKLELERLKMEQEKLKLEKEKRDKEDAYRLLQSQQQQQLEIEKLKLENERLKLRKNDDDDDKVSDSSGSSNGAKVTVQAKDDIHYYGEMNDEKQLLIDDAVKCTAAVESVVISCRWKDQGWGNQKSRIYLRITDSSGKVKQDIDVFGIAPHSWETVNKTLDNGNTFIKGIVQGDILRFARYVGGGGGHEMFVNSFKAVINFNVLGETAKIEFRTLHFVGEYNDQKQLLVRDSIKCPAPVDSIKITCEWKDQGWGNQKGTLYVRVTDSSGSAQDYDCFGIAPHNWEAVTKEFNENNSKWIPKIEAGSLIQLIRYVGGGGGHELFVDNFTAIVTFKAASRADTVVKATQNFHFIGPLNDSKQLLFDDSIKCPAKAKSIHFSCRWKDQGWGNQKSMLYLQVVKSDGTSKDFDISNHVAPHSWEDLSVTFDGKHFAIQTIASGDKLRFFRYVGGGGGHELFVNDFQVRVKWA